MFLWIPVPYHKETVPKLSRMDTAALTIIQQNADQMLQEGDLTFETRLSQGRGAATHTFTACMKRREGIVELTSKTTRIEEAPSIASTLMGHITTQPSEDGGNPHHSGRTGHSTPRHPIQICNIRTGRPILSDNRTNGRIDGCGERQARMGEFTSRRQWRSWPALKEWIFHQGNQSWDMTFFRGNGGIWAKFGRQGEYGRNGPMQLSPQELLCMAAIQSAYNLDTSPNRMDLYADKRPLSQHRAGSDSWLTAVALLDPHTIYSTAATIKPCARTNGQVYNNEGSSSLCYSVWGWRSHHNHAHQDG